MKPLPHSWKYSKAIETIYLAYQKHSLGLPGSRVLKILFSNPAAEGEIRPGFRFTNHELTFERLSSARLKDYDLVVPLTDPDLSYLSDLNDQIIDNTIPLPSKASLELCSDKYLFNQEMIKIGFGRFIPQLTGFGYPYIIKKRVDTGGRHCHLVFDSIQERMFDDIRAQPEYFTQAAISGRREYTTHLLVKEKKTLCSLTLIFGYETDLSIKGRDKMSYSRICRCPYLDVFSSILGAIGFEGLCSINYKICNGRLWIFEINPRVGSSLHPYLFLFVERALRNGKSG